jgi:hypothetical protein
LENLASLQLGITPSVNPQMTIIVKVLTILFFNEMRGKPLDLIQIIHVDDIEAEYKSRVIADLLYSVRDTLKRVVIQGPGSGLVIPSLGRQIEELSLLRQFYVMDPKWDQPLASEFIDSLVSKKELVNVLLPAMHDSDVWKWRSISDKTAAWKSFAFFGSSDMFRRVYSVGFSHVCVLDPSVYNPPFSTRLQFSGHSLITSLAYQKIADFLPDESSRARFMQLETLDVRGLRAQHLAGLATKIRFLSSLKTLRIELDEPTFDQNQAEQLANDSIFQILEHPQLVTFEFKINQPVMEPLNLIRLLDALISRKNSSKIAIIGFAVRSRQSIEFPSDERMIEWRLRHSGLEKFRIVVNQVKLIEFERGKKNEL